MRCCKCLEKKFTAGDCNEKGPRAGENLAIEFKKATQLRFLVLSGYELICNLCRKQDIELDPVDDKELIEYE